MARRTVHQVASALEDDADQAQALLPEDVLKTGENDRLAQRRYWMAVGSVSLAAVGCLAVVLGAASTSSSGSSPGALRYASRSESEMRLRHEQPSLHRELLRPMKEAKAAAAAAAPAAANEDGDEPAEDLEATTYDPAKAAYEQHQRDLATASTSDSANPSATAERTVAKAAAAQPNGTAAKVAAVTAAAKGAGITSPATVAAVTVAAKGASSTSPATVPQVLPPIAPELGTPGTDAAAANSSGHVAQEAKPKDKKPKAIHDSRHVGCSTQPKPSDDDTDAPEIPGSKGTVKLWGQCGGKGYKGDTECVTGLKCVAKHIKGYRSYKQCKPDPEFKCQSAEGNPDMACYYKVTWDMETGIIKRPDQYHGLTPESSFQEFQEQNFNFLPEKSKCPAPCAPGTCFEVLANEGCDSFNEWACEEDDRSLAFDCCCRKYHPNVTKRWDVVKKEKEANKPVTPSLFCIAMVLPRSYEVELMRGQFERGLGIFDPVCDGWAVFSNESLSMNCESASKKFDTVVMNGTLEVKRGGDFNSALNTGVFERFWDAVLEDGRAWSYDWVVKVDPDTLFFPSRLKGIINSGAGPFGKKEPAGGMYINNCFLGMHGPIEVFTKRALGNYMNGKADCIKGKPGKKGQEDVFLRECFKQLGVEQEDAFNLLLEGENACKEKPSTQQPHSRPPCFAPEAAFHPFKGIRSMMRCWAEAVSHEVVGDMAPVTDPPSAENGRHG